MQAVIPKGASVRVAPWRPVELNLGRASSQDASAPAQVEPSVEAEQCPELGSFPTLAELEALRRDGYQEGVESGKQEVQSRLASQIEGIGKAFEQLPVELAAIDAAYEKFFSDVGRAVAAALEALPPAGLAERIQRALTTMSKPEGLSLHLNPEDVAALYEVAPEVLSREGLSVKESSEVQCGGFLIRSPFGGVDATLETALQNLKRALRNA